MRFHNDRASCSKRGRCIAAGNRKREGEIASPKHRDGTEWQLAQAQVWPGEGLSLRLGGVDADIKKIAIANDAGEQPQLSGGSRALAFQAAAREPCLCHAPDDEMVTETVDVVGNGFQESCPYFQRQCSISAERLLRQSGGSRDFVLRGARKHWLDRLASRGIDGMESVASPGTLRAPNQQMPLNAHSLFRSG
jgi:hypothetical protein